MRLIYAFARRDIAFQSAQPFSWLIQIVSMLAVAGMFFFIGKTFGQQDSGALHAFHGRYFAFVLIGLVFARFQQVSLTSFSSAIRRDQISGTLEAMLVTRTGVPSIVLGASCWSFLYTAIQAIIMLLIGALLFGVNLHHANVPTALVALFLSVLAISPIGIAAAASVIAFRQGDSALGIITTATNFLGGVFFPVAVLPGPFQVAAALFPITHALAAVRASMLMGSGFHAVAGDLIVLAGFAVIGLPLSLFAFTSAVNRARRVGSLSYT